MTAKSEIKGRKVRWSEERQHWVYLDDNRDVDAGKMSDEDTREFLKNRTDDGPPKSEIQGHEVYWDGSVWRWSHTKDVLAMTGIEADQLNNIVPGGIPIGIPIDTPQPSKPKSEIKGREVEWHGIGKDGGWRFRDSSDPVTVFTEQDANYLEGQVPGSITNPESKHFRPPEYHKVTPQPSSCEGCCAYGVQHPGSPHVCPPSGHETEKRRVGDREVEWRGSLDRGGWYYCDNNSLYVSAITRVRINDTIIEWNDDFEHWVYFNTQTRAVLECDIEKKKAELFVQIESDKELPPPIITISDPDDDPSPYKKMWTEGGPSLLQRIIADVPDGCVVTLRIDKREGGECDCEDDDD